MSFSQKSFLINEETEAGEVKKTNTPEQCCTSAGSYSPTGADIQEFCQLIGRLKSAVAGVLTLWKSVNATNQASSLPLRQTIVKDMDNFI